MNKDIEVEQILIKIADIIAAILQFPEQVILVVSIYIPGGNAQALQDTHNALH